MEFDFPSPDPDNYHQQQLIIGAAEDSSSVAAPVKPKLPKYITLRSFANNQYLRYIDQPDSYVSHLDFSGGNPEDEKSFNFSSKSKFEVESAKSSDDYVHIKSCYNHKYWECRPETNHVTATASRPLEDDTNNACTLFQPIYENVVNQNKILRLLHVSSKKFLSPRPSGRHQYLLEVAFASEDKDTLRDLLTVIDWKTIVILPKRLVFKGQNGKYLTAYPDGGYHYMGFQSENNYQQLVANEITQRPDGIVSIRNNYFDKFWRSNDETGGWIYVNGDSEQTAGVRFKPVALGAATTEIALQSLHNKKFCTFSDDDETSCLSASSLLIDKNSHMTIEEPVVSRVIDSVKYRLQDARKFGETSVFVDSDSIQNKTDDSRTEFTKAITLADTNSSTWNYMAGVKLGVSMTLTASVPAIVDGELEISAEIGKSYKWGVADKEDIEVGGKLTAKVPPRSKLTVNLTYTKGSCEVPFSYVQHDTFTDGVLETTEMEDGVYTGISCYSFKFETIQTAL